LARNASELTVKKRPIVRKWKIFVLVVVVAALTTSSMGIYYLFIYRKTGSKTWTVDDDGPADFSRIQEALNVASDGETIKVATGTYYEGYIEIKKALVLSGENKNTTIIDGKGGAGAVVAIKANNVNINGFTIRNGAWGTAGIYMGYASGCILRDNLIVSNAEGSGIDFYYSNNNNVSSNSITSNYRGIELEYSSNNIINDNNISSNVDGIYLSYESINNTFNGNVVMNNSLHGVYYYSFYGEKPCNNNALIANTIAKNSRGARLDYSTGNILTGNIVSNNSEFGISLFRSNGSLIGNTLKHNGEYSIAISGTSGNKISRNKITNSETGIDLSECSNSALKENTICDNKYAIDIWGNNNLICENTIADNTEGIRITYCNGNIVYHNNFINNSMQVYVRESINAWDDGYPSGGNYWSDHVCIGNPSDGSQPYTGDANNIDHYPFKDPLQVLIIP